MADNTNKMAAWILNRGRILKIDSVVVRYAKDEGSGEFGYACELYHRNGVERKWDGVASDENRLDDIGVLSRELIGAKFTKTEYSIRDRVYGIKSEDERGKRAIRKLAKVEDFLITVGDIECLRQYLAERDFMSDAELAEDLKKHINLASGGSGLLQFGKYDIKLIRKKMREL